MVDLFDDKDDLYDEGEENKKIKKPARSYFDEPGGLRNTTWMEIQTRQAQKLISGRKRTKDVSAIIGVMDFGRRMKLLWLSAEADDPYADWFLIQIEDSIKESRVMIKEKKAWLDDVLNAMEGINVEIAHSLKPINVSIYFQNPIGYMGAYLVKDFDSLACSVFTARHLGLIDRATSENILGLAGKSIRRTFSLVTLWKFTGVTRDDLEQKNKNSQSAIEMYGTCPKNILSKQKRAKTAPAIKERQFKNGKRINLIKNDDKPESKNNEIISVDARKKIAVAEALSS